MGLNVPGLVGLSVFYAITLATGIWASLRSKRDKKNRSTSEMAIVGDRNINFLVGLFTATGKCS